jgi:hypothetical protein
VRLVELRFPTNRGQPRHPMEFAVEALHYPLRRLRSNNASHGDDTNTRIWRMSSATPCPSKNETARTATIAQLKQTCRASL